MTVRNTEADASRSQRNVGRATAAGLEQRFSDLYGRFGRSAIRLGYVLTGDEHSAEELAQEAFVRVLGRHRKLSDADEFERYLKRTLVNVWKRGLRRKALARVHLAREKGALAEIPDPEYEAGLRDQSWQAIRRLPIRQRAAVYLRYYEDQSAESIAATLDCSEMAVKALLKRAMQQLRRDMEVDE